MPHIHIKPGQHDHTVSMFIVRIDGNEPKIMFHLHKKYKVYMQFGGHIELDENPWQTLIREIKEETGYDINQLKVLQPRTRVKDLGKVIVHPLPIAYTTHNAAPGHYHIDVAYALIADHEPYGKHAKAESNDFKLFTSKELGALPPKKTYENARKNALFILKNFSNPHWELIPASEIASSF